jgi:hypothetical protein
LAGGACDHPLSKVIRTGDVGRGYELGGWLLLDELHLFAPARAAQPFEQLKRSHRSHPGDLRERRGGEHADRETPLGETGDQIADHEVAVRGGDVHVAVDELLLKAAPDVVGEPPGWGDDPNTVLSTYAHLLPQSDELAAERVAALLV